MKNVERVIENLPVATRPDEDPTRCRIGPVSRLIATLPLVAICLCVATGYAAEVWSRKSSTTGDLPAPNAGQQQTCCVVGDFDGDRDLDILLKPYHHRAPRLDILLNPGR